MCLCASLWILMHHRVGARAAAPDAQGEGADGGAGAALLALSQESPGEGDGTREVVGHGFVADRAVVYRELEHHVELRQQRDDKFNALLLLFRFKHGINTGAYFPISLA